MSIIREYSYLFLIIITNLVFIACSANDPVLVNNQIVRIGEVESIRVLEPKLDYKTIQDEDPINPSEYHGEKVSIYVKKLSEEILAGKFFNVISDITNTSGMTLSIDLEIFVGPEAYFNPLTGEFRSSMSRTVINGMIVNSITNKIIWKNYVQVREIPDPKSIKFKKAIELLYSNLEK